MLQILCRGYIINSIWYIERIIGKKVGAGQKMFREPPKAAGRKAGRKPKPRGVPAASSAEETLQKGKWS